MSQKNCANMLKGIVLLAAAAAAAVYFILAPHIAVDVVRNYPEYGYAFWPRLGYVLLSCIPVFWAFADAWAIFTRIGLDHSFCAENARGMRHIAILAAAESAYLLAGNLALSFFVVNHPGVFLFFTVLAFLALIVCGVCAALSMLIQKASRLQEENDLTI